MAGQDALIRSMLEALGERRATVEASYTGIIGLVIAVLRREHSMSQSELSRRSGVSQPTISRMEMGEADITVPQMDAITRSLKTDPSFVFNIADKFRRELLRQKIEVQPKVGIKVQTKATAGNKSGVGPAAVVALSGALLAGNPLGFLVGAAVAAMIKSEKEKS